MQLKNQFKSCDLDLISNEVIHLHESARTLEQYSRCLDAARKIRECADELSELMKQIANTRNSD